MKITKILKELEIKGRGDSSSRELTLTKLAIGTIKVAAKVVKEIHKSPEHVAVTGRVLKGFTIVGVEQSAIVGRRIAKEFNKEMTK